MSAMVEDDEERAAELSCEMIDAARALMEDHGWSREDVMSTLEGVLGR